jgi:hypothetical protein
MTSFQDGQNLQTQSQTLCQAVKSLGLPSVSRLAEIQYVITHSQLQNDLMEHLWMLKGSLVLLFIWYLYFDQTMFYLCVCLTKTMPS